MTESEKQLVRELVDALDYLLAQSVDMDLKYGIGLSEGGQEARKMSLDAIAKASRQLIWLNRN